MVKIVIIGCGNLLASDDAVGIEVIKILSQREFPPQVELIEAGTPGLSLVHMLEGADKAIIIDAVMSGAEPGTIYRFTADNLPSRDIVPSSLHDLNLVDAIELGRQLQDELMPKDIVIIGVEISRAEKFRIGLTPEVERAIPQVVEAVLRELGEGETPG